MGTQYVLYWSDAVQVTYAGGTCLQLSPCGTTFICEQPFSADRQHPIHASSNSIQQRTQFATSAFRQRVCDALDFRNRFALRPFLCRELIEPENILRSPADVSSVAWPVTVRDGEFLVYGDGSVQLSSVVAEPGALRTSVCLSPTRYTFTVRFPAKLAQSLISLRAGMDVADSIVSSSLEYSWVVQQHSIASYPELWTHPVKLLAEFSQTEDYKTCLATASRDTPSHFHDSPVVDAVVRGVLPTSLELKCSAPHLHRRNPITSEDFTDYFHDRIKILSTGGTTYRLLWDAEPRAVEVYPSDGSIIRSTGHTRRHYVHYMFNSTSRQVEERTYSSLNPPPTSLNLSYSVSRFLSLAARLLELMHDPCLELTTGDQPICWKEQAKSAASLSSRDHVTLLPGVRTLEECSVALVGRFSAYTDGSVRVVFDDRTCLDMHGLHWEPHVYNRLLSQNVSSEEIESYITWVGARRSSRKSRGEDFSDNVCRLLLPNGHYQFVDVLQPQLPYQTYMSRALEFAAWVNTPLSSRHGNNLCHSFTTSDDPRHIADIQLKKIQCFSYLLDRTLQEPPAEPRPPDEHLTNQQRRHLPLPDVTSSRESIAMAAVSVAERALCQSAELLNDIDSLLSTANQ